MSYIKISFIDLLVSLSLIGSALLIVYLEKIKLEKDILIGALRTFLQLFLIGYILKIIFDLNKWYLILILVSIMILIAGYDALRRVKKRIPYAYLIVAGSLTLSAGFTLFLVLGPVLKVKPWFTPQYLIPIAGMIIGNSMSAASLALDRLLSEVKLRRYEIEAALSLGASFYEASHFALKEAFRAALIPTINTMMIVGVVQLPGMMTGQIIAGANPQDAVRYQILVMYMILSASTLTTFLTLRCSSMQIFTKFHQLKEEYILEN